MDHTRLKVAIRTVLLGALLSGLVMVALDGAKPSEARAQPTATTGLSLARGAPAASGIGAHVDSFPITCGETATPIVPPGGGRMFSYACQNSSTTKVAFGDANIGDPGSNQTSPIFCATNCPSQEAFADVSLEYCRGDTSTVVYCRALVPFAP